jgi:hypothetical protein
MTFKPKIWFPVAVAAAALNLAGMGAAINAAEIPHAGLHALLAAAFSYWAWRLYEKRKPLEAQAQLSELEDDVSHLREELADANERIDFAERMLVQQAEKRRDPPPPAP